MPDALARFEEEGNLAEAQGEERSGVTWKEDARYGPMEWGAGQMILEIQEVEGEALLPFLVLKCNQYMLQYHRNLFAALR
jgi:hypothetical protein